ncbi:hypothetical protein [Sphingomonas sp.]|uniref:CC_3452 family protein n=1 Tax=Sphingomonas sp. TaxID=28214 RepID=UPI001B25D7E6|nr:hypothetical protein [Sphingomonas sp.]MBO9713055.1 hypothetical protein [Sphingomonas sp.]
MIRLLPVAAVAAATLALAPAASFAQTARGYYAATPVTAPEKASLVTRTTVWKCGEGVCTAAKATSRDAIMCELVAGEVGKLSAFTANGKEFDAASLEKCNARAR